MTGTVIDKIVKKLHEIEEHRHGELVVRIADGKVVFMEMRLPEKIV